MATGGEEYLDPDTPSKALESCQNPRTGHTPLFPHPLPTPQLSDSIQQIPAEPHMTTKSRCSWLFFVFSVWQSTTTKGGHMQLTQYLICVATRHEQAKDAYEEELKEQWSRTRKKKPGRPTTPTYDDERALLRAVIGSVRGKPDCLKKLSLQAIGCLAYLLKSKMANDPFTEGHEIVGRLVCDPERTIDYLQSFAELNEQKWMRLLETPSTSFTDQPPFSWLQTFVELGDAFHQQMGAAHNSTRLFASNDAYLDAVFNYLQTMIRDGSNTYRIDDPEADLTVQPYEWHRKIVMRVEASTAQLPAAEVQKSCNLSTYQYLCLIGLLATRDGDVRYDFNDTNDVIRLFAKGRICRKRMREHLFDDKSPLKQQKLIQNGQSSFGETIELTQLALTALVGKQEEKKSKKELETRIKKKTLFDYEEPKLKKESVMLPAQVMDAIRSILFSESNLGKRIRKSWHASLPAAWGSPTGSTILLYGPPGTGKSLTAQYLASELKLPLLKIDAAKVLSCWVGESEQNVRRIFDDYTMLQKETGKSAVLLLNEADQLLGSRDAGRSSVDRMNNNMQNLFLEGLEKFSGILVATTNRRDLLDDAFSRRFTYKLELPPPDRLLRMELWKTHLPEKRLADDVEIGQLAELGLTGGEIRLVVERAVRIAAYRGMPKIGNNVLKEIAQEELASRLKKCGNARKIGFDIINTQ
jgi:hypothetical protein